MTDQLKTQVREAAYKSLLKTSPQIIDGLKKMLSSGETAKNIERHFARKYGNGNLMSEATICAAYHLESHPELLAAQS